MLVSCKAGKAWLAKLTSFGRKSLLEHGNLSSKPSALGVSAERSGLDDALFSDRYFIANF